MAVLDSMRLTATGADVQGNAHDHKKIGNPHDCAAGDGIRPDVVSYSAAITALGRGRQRHRALKLLREMREEGVAPNVSMISYTKRVIDRSEVGRGEHCLVCFFVKKVYFGLFLALFSVRVC